MVIWIKNMGVLCKDGTLYVNNVYLIFKNCLITVNETSVIACTFKLV